MWKIWLRGSTTHHRFLEFDLSLLRGEANLLRLSMVAHALVDK
jgi:hypothetical protein